MTMPWSTQQTFQSKYSATVWQLVDFELLELVGAIIKIELMGTTGNRYRELKDSIRRKMSNISRYELHLV